MTLVLSDFHPTFRLNRVSEGFGLEECLGSSVPSMNKDINRFLPSVKGEINPRSLWGDVVKNGI